MKTKKPLIVFGIVAGLINVLGWWVFNQVLGTDPEKMDFDRQEVIGYTAMVLSFTMVFFGIKNYRDKQKNGIISFKDAFTNGLLIVLVASAIYVIGWEIYFPNFMSNFGDQYEAHLIQGYRESGLSESEIELKQAEMDKWMEYYKNPFIRIGITFMEIFPVGLVVALFSALILKRKN